MPLEFLGEKIGTVSIIDDDPEARTGYGYTIEDLNLKPLLQDMGPRDDLDTYIELVGAKADAILCDYRLRQRNYSYFDGDEIVAACYRKGIPALLCTAYSDWDVTMMRQLRRFIPVLVKTEDLSPEVIARGFERCIKEISGEVPPSRVASRTQIRVVESEPDGGYFYAVIPGWSASKKIRITIAEVPEGMRALLTPDARLHALVNVGAESIEELFISDWEPK